MMLTLEISVEGPDALPAYQRLTINPMDWLANHDLYLREVVKLTDRALFEFSQPDRYRAPPRPRFIYYRAWAQCPAGIVQQNILVTPLEWASGQHGVLSKMEATTMRVANLALLEEARA